MRGSFWKAMLLRVGTAVWAISVGHSPIFGDEPAAERAKEGGVKDVTVRVVATLEGKYWIGVQAEPADETLRSQLALSNGLVVNDIIPESPAAAAGLEKHDILLKFGDTAINSVSDLVGAVEKTKDQEAEIQLLRAGKAKTLKVKPAERSAENAELRVPLRLEIQELEKTLTDDQRKAFRFHTLGPGFLAREGQWTPSATEPTFPENLALSITKEGNTPAKICVKRGDQSWETTEDKLQELPEDVRRTVERFLTRPPHMIVLNRAAGIQALMPTPPPEAVEQALKQHQAHAEAIRKNAEEHRARVEQQLRATKKQSDAESAHAKAIDELRKSVEELRTQVEKLREEGTKK